MICLAVEGLITIGGFDGVVVPLGIREAHGITAVWEPDPCPAGWRPLVWLAPPRNLEEVYARRVERELDRDDGRNAELVVLATTGETWQQWMQKLWLSHGTAPWRMLLVFGNVGTRTTEQWSKRGAGAWAIVGVNGQRFD